jgi:hypothetical protein
VDLCLRLWGCEGSFVLLVVLQMWVERGEPDLWEH